MDTSKKNAIQIELTMTTTTLPSYYASLLSTNLLPATLNERWSSYFISYYTLYHHFQTFLPFHKRARSTLMSPFAKTISSTLLDGEGRPSNSARANETKRRNGMSHPHLRFARSLYPCWALRCIESLNHPDSGGYHRAGPIIHIKFGIRNFQQFRHWFMNVFCCFLVI